MNTILHWLLLAAAVGIGWSLGRWGVRRQENGSAIEDEESLRDRLQFLFTNYSDEAIESFVETLAVSRDTVNLHLSIGAHFRNKGEVERATLIHQNLLARPELPARFSSQVTYELALDYLAAGLLDRAEALLHELMGTKRYGRKAAEQLIQIYQREKDWEKARQVAAILVSGDDSPALRKQLAHILCEQASVALAHDDRTEARRCLNEALEYDNSCVRASLLLAEIHHKAHENREAQNLLLRVFDQNPAFGPEAVPLLVRFAREQGAERRLRRLLYKLYERHPSTTLLLAMVEAEERVAGAGKARAVLERELERKPSLRGLLRLISFNGADVDGLRAEGQLVRRVGETLLSNKPVYQCNRCGFSGQQLHWLCPSCKSWESIEPVRGVDGE